MREFIDNIWSGLKKFWFHSVRRQVVLTFAIAFSLLSATFVTYITEQQRGFFAQRGEEQALQVAAAVATTSVSWVLANDLAGLQEVVQAASAYPDLRYTMVLNPQGRVLAHTDPALVDTYINDTASRNVLQGPPQATLVTRSGKLFDAAVPIMARQHLIGWARVGVGMESYTANLQSIAREGLVFLLLSIALSALLAGLVARRITGGLDKLTRLTRQVRQGERGLRVHMRAQDEIGQLGDDINRMLNALEESEEKFSKISQNAQDAIITTDQDGRINGWNPAAAAMFGYLPGEVMGQDLHRLLAPERVQQQAAQGMATFQSSGNGPVLGKTLELDARRRNGEEFPIELSIAPMKIGEHWHAIGIARDISARRQALALQRQLAAIVESSGDAIIGKDVDGIITSWNAGAEHLYGYNAQEAIGQSTAMLAPAELRGEIPQLIEKVRQSGAVENHETVRLRKDGTRLYVTLTLSPIYNEGGQLSGISVIAHDITERKQAELLLRRLNRALRTISLCNEVLVHAPDEASLLQQMCDIIVQAGGYRAAWVDLLDPHTPRTLRRAALASAEASAMDILPCPNWAGDDPDCCPTASAAALGKLQVVQDLRSSAAAEPWRSTALGLGYVATAALPLVAEQRVLGVLTLHAGEAQAFNDDEIRLLQELAADLAFGIQSLRIYDERDAALQERQRDLERLRQNLEDTVQAIAATVEMRDPYTAGHQRRVADLAADIAREMGIAEEEIHGIHLAGIVHDLGKISIPAEILSKPSALSPLEFGLIKAHPQVGHDILSAIDFPWPIADMVLQHHERLDGSGYPQGLRGEQILLGARILAVADVVEAMASHRPYRPGKGVDVALAEIERGSGSAYDAQAAAACLRLFRDKHYSLDSPATHLA